MMRMWRRRTTKPALALDFAIASLGGAVVVVMLSLGARLIAPSFALDAPTSPPPSQPSVGDCSVGGNNSGPFSPNCHNTYLGPPRRKDGLYQNGQFVGIVQGYKMSDDRKQLILTNVHISGVGIDLKVNLETQMFSINCPGLAASNDQNSTLSVFFNGEMACAIVGKAN